MSGFLHGRTQTGLVARHEFSSGPVAPGVALPIRQILDLGNGVVFSVTAHTGRPVGGAGGVRMATEVMTHSFLWEGGVITRVVSSGDTPEARAAAERLAELRG